MTFADIYNNVKNIEENKFAQYYSNNSSNIFTIYSIINEILNTLDVSSAYTSYINTTTQKIIKISAQANIQNILGLRIAESPVYTNKAITNTSGPTSMVNIAQQIYESAITTTANTNTSVQLNRLQNELKFNHITSFDDILKFRLNTNDIIFSKDIKYLILKFIQLLSNIYIFNVSVFYKIRQFVGILKVNTNNGKPIRAKNTGDSKGYQFVMGISPYIEKNYTAIVSNATSDKYAGSNNTTLVYRNSATFINNINNTNTSLNNLIYCSELESDQPTFDITSQVGSNGVLKVFKQFQYQKYNLLDNIDMSIFNIDNGEIISYERIKSLIYYIFQVWQQNLQLCQCNVFICHSNCHGNSLDASADSSPGNPVGSIDVDYYYSVQLIDLSQITATTTTTTSTSQNTDEETGDTSYSSSSSSETLLDVSEALIDAGAQNYSAHDKGIDSLTITFKNNNYSLPDKTKIKFCWPKNAKAKLTMKISLEKLTYKENSDGTIDRQYTIVNYDGINYNNFIELTRTNTSTKETQITNDAYTKLNKQNLLKMIYESDDTYTLYVLVNNT